jgi:hypothetical protein
MSVTQMSEFRERQMREQFERAETASQFIMDMWYEAVDKERYLPWELSIKLIEQIMVDHGITLQDLAGNQGS